MVCGGLCSGLCSGLWWFAVVCGGLCSGLWWFAVVCGGLWWFVVFSATRPLHSGYFCAFLSADFFRQNSLFQTIL